MRLQGKQRKRERERERERKESIHKLQDSLGRSIICKIKIIKKKKREREERIFKEKISLKTHLGISEK